MVKYRVFSKAVRHALEVIGDQTSLRTLVVEAGRYHEGDSYPISSDSIACTVRNKWREQQNINRDCRTYEGQPRRDMQNDSSFTNKGWKLLTEVVAKVGADKVAKLLNEFHSIDQLRELTDDIATIKKAA